MRLINQIVLHPVLLMVSLIVLSAEADKSCSKSFQQKSKTLPLYKRDIPSHFYSINKDFVKDSYD